jgi:hypothetical protein
LTIFCIFADPHRDGAEVGELTSAAPISLVSGHSETFCLAQAPLVDTICALIPFSLKDVCDKTTMLQVRILTCISAAIFPIKAVPFLLTDTKIPLPPPSSEKLRQDSFLSLYHHFGFLFSTMYNISLSNHFRDLGKCKI